MNNWFSKHPEAINEQEKLVIILEHAGHDLRNIIQEDIGFTLSDASRLVSKACSKAWADKLPVATSGFRFEKQFIQKITGAVYFEHLLDAVVNSRRFSALLPSGWVKSVHRAEFGIPESERGNPDRIIFDSKDKLQSLLSCKHLNDYKSLWKSMGIDWDYTNKVITNFEKWSKSGYLKTADDKLILQVINDLPKEGDILELLNNEIIYPMEKAS
jgi:hypothetical protein